MGHLKLFLAGIAVGCAGLAQAAPATLSAAQMDSVSAGSAVMAFSDVMTDGNMMAVSSASVSSGGGGMAPAVVSASVTNTPVASNTVASNTVPSGPVGNSPAVTLSIQLPGIVVTGMDVVTLLR